MKKIVAVLLLAAVLLAAGIGYFFNTNLILGGNVYSKNARELKLSAEELQDPQILEGLTNLEELSLLDLRDTKLTVQQFESLKKKLPDCEILWKISFQGAYLDLNTEELTIESITAEDIGLLAYLPRLKRINAEACSDLDAIQQIQETYPQCAVSYQVPLAGQTLAWDAAALTAEDADVQELTQMLAYLPQMEEVKLTGAVPENEEIYGLMQRYPEIRFVWDFTFFGQSVSSETKEIDLSGIKMESVEEVEQGLKYFNNLERVTMCDCGLPSEELDALWKRHPEIRFVWNVKIGKAVVRTDAVGFMPFTYGYSGVGNDAADNLRDSDCAEMKYLVDLVCIDLGHMAVRDLSFVQYMPNLEYLLLCDNSLRDVSPLAGLKKLKYLELFNNPISDISALAECPALEDVNVTYNTIKDITPLLGLKNLKNLWITGCFLTEAQVQQLKDELPDVRLVLDSGASTGAGWRELPNYYAQRDILGMWYMSTP